MPRYTSSDALRCGVPLGGIGAGKIEVFPDGTLNNFTIYNNWSHPVKNANIGNHFAIFAETEAGRKAAFLQTAAIGRFPTVQHIDYLGLYPRARLEYSDPGLPVSVTLDAFSPVIPGDYEASALPVAIFRFTVANPGASTARVSIMATHLNRCGQWVVGRKNRVERLGDLLGVTFGVERALPDDVTAGETCLLAATQGARKSCRVQWNLKERQLFRLTPEDEEIEPWPEFSETGQILEAGEGFEVTGERYEPAGAVTQSLEVPPGGSVILDFVLAWHMPNHHVGHVYERRFRSAAEVALQVAPRVDEFLRAVTSWQDLVINTSMPEPLKDAVLNNLYPLTSNTWWGREGEFVMYEAPEACPLMDTLDVRYYSSVATAMLFPKLDMKGLEQLAKAQRPSGYIPHDLGRNRIDMPSDGTTAPPLWKDLCPKFVLQVYRDFIWTGDADWARSLYPAVKAAMKWSLTADRDGDGLPDNEGADQTFDNWVFKGANSYTSSIYLAACAVAAELARVAGDKEFASECDARLEVGKRTFVEKLWTGRYFRATERDNACTAGQLNGLWYAHLVGLRRTLLPEDKVGLAVSEMLTWNARDSAFGATNSILNGGERDKSNIHSSSVWPGESYALASLAIYEGRVQDGIDLALKVWRNFTDVQMSPWDQPDVIDPDTGAKRFGDRYLRNMCVWAVMLALARSMPDVEEALRRLTERVFAAGKANDQLEL